MTNTKSKLVVEQIKSPIGRPAVQRTTLIGLGLNTQQARPPRRTRRYAGRPWHDR